VFHYFDILVFIFFEKVNRQIAKSPNRQIANSAAKIYKPFLKNNKNENFFKVYL